MQKYICDKCGFKVELPKLDKEDLICPICEGILISEEIMKEKEEMAEMIDKDKDDDLTPKQDALEDIVDRDIVNSMKENITVMGNDACFAIIEDMINAYQRSAYRKYFIQAGGEIPQGDPITI